VKLPRGPGRSISTGLNENRLGHALMQSHSTADRSSAPIKRPAKLAPLSAGCSPARGGARLTAQEYRLHGWVLQGVVSRRPARWSAQAAVSAVLPVVLSRHLYARLLVPPLQGALQLVQGPSCTVYLQQQPQQQASCYTGTPLYGRSGPPDFYCMTGACEVLMACRRGCHHAHAEHTRGLTRGVQRCHAAGNTRPVVAA
jgi:hypothetical protein